MKWYINERKEMMKNSILTKREQEIFELLVKNLTTKDIAKKLMIFMF